MTLSTRLRGVAVGIAVGALTAAAVAVAVNPPANATATAGSTLTDLQSHLAAAQADASQLGILLAGNATSPTPLPTPSPTRSPSPTPTVTSSPSLSPSSSGSVGAFPSASNTGVPAGVTLTAYSGPTTISTCGTVIDSKTITGDLLITAGNGTHAATTPCVTIKNSKLAGTVEVDGGPLVMLDDEIAAPTTTGQSTVLGANFYLWRVNLHGGAKGGVQCDGFCEVHDSWIHDFYLTGSSHYDGIGSNGTGGNPLLIDHNSIGCTFYAQAAGATGGCSANIGLFGDFSVISHVTITNNLFLASPEASYALYANASQPGKSYPNGDHIVVTGNVFQRGTTGNCAYYGPLTGWGAGGGGNTWAANTFDDGAVIVP